MKGFFRCICLLIFALAFTRCVPSAENRGGIVALTPALTEVVLELGHGASLIATSPYTTDKRAADVRRISPTGTLEIIAAMHPDIVLTQESESLLAHKLSKLNVKTLTLPMTTMADIERAISSVGQALNVPTIARNRISSFRSDLAQNRAKYDTLPNRPKVLIIIDRLDMRMQQFYIAQKPAFLADLFEGCGMSVISGGDAPWARIDAEKLYQLNPEYIAFLERTPEDAAETKHDFANRFSGLDAVKNDRLIVYDRADITVPGPNSGKRQTPLCEHIHAFLERDSLSKNYNDT